MTGAPQARMDDLLAFNQQLLTLIEAGIPVELGDDTPGEHVPAQLAQINSRVALQVGLGQSLDRAIANDSLIPAAYRAAWETWFHGQQPIEALNSLASQAAGRRAMQMNVGNALIQPLIVLSLVYLGFIYIVLIAAQQLETTYSQLGQPPSLSLQFLLTARHWLPVWGFVLPIAIALCVVCWWYLSGTWSYRWLPGRTRLIESISKANYAENVAKLLDTNHSLAESLQLVGPIKTKAAAPAMLRWAFAAEVEDVSRVTLLRFVARAYRDSAKREIRRWHVWLPVFMGVTFCGALVLMYGLSLFTPMIELLKTLTEP
ncbi:MAG: hypothetical protein SFV81_26295 [Pirellulaceae bacterium]|nr:hypothetical protein [Pirellulaceae bacterium]